MELFKCSISCNRYRHLEAESIITLLVFVCERFALANRNSLTEPLPSGCCCLLLLWIELEAN